MDKVFVQVMFAQRDLFILIGLVSRLHTAKESNVGNGDRPINQMEGM
ncbi:hypothetical protein KSB_17330 [Ktedonobacter robiniae]|uniref:Uncharacterized protein n=1 Tax=Ktedonobacter robiniae TaxID=2778365 RepID=A0ABQ3UKQ2_9CHLR|nr:hypothetical protein KSB_17330 [Ktedonobacter robiniae]